jgi:selenocysteine lyase/cysteine desulfurase
MNLIADALAERGDVLSCELEFPVSILPWMHRGCGVRLIKAHGGEIQAEDFARAMTGGARIISLSHVQYSNGFRAPLEEIGALKGERALVVNASQSVGAFEVDVRRMRIDALCATGHKWMTAGYGSGFVYLSRRMLEQTRTRAIGWKTRSPCAMMIMGCGATQPRAQSLGARTSPASSPWARASSAFLRLEGRR